ncbi:hypothetical protein COW36_12760 [bacterium (Candidatus Blackallbacteria) CG17_big_fil_post_rev_8_21_14_2_50_48_46]|uniref:Uncharacterized protein n=1 Tax=bacterium (Candidatus Blackallbacteria) CG17_big_fil_post_rev_8_21_14_2_50_48_46 TaxID=2014261 RepID=A0A2M7G422_9BACT|nr:MAG: hypothetical protein COW64_02505 [bacterium (Candidatus Blackallbacteria) CG18_big_fil_WC_8_21_14_2_50_49_26]PIW16632.1 MAG: hypothetical protein COW36_12760 [bacterium (Candidatus Blackallbacteria) CG17_big_fil_post_rev_8_21_14_2_50_48_46]PIW46139.1 MAG: hypothetical protein COW20_18020 [bacterium (Candidatus Blackallbacteria) CG13_big_fil_rev_8_21_14_2_50_49_14]
MEYYPAQNQSTIFGLELCVIAKLFFSLLILGLSSSPVEAAESSPSPASGAVVEINLGSLLGKMNPYQETFSTLYGVLKELSHDPDKVTSYTADLPHEVHVGDELEFTISQVDDEATLVFDGITQTLKMNQPPWRKVVKVRREGENLVLFSIGQGMINPQTWRGNLVVRNLTKNEELIDHHPSGNDYLAPGRRRIYLFKFKARQRIFGVF